MTRTPITAAAAARLAILATWTDALLAEVSDLARSCAARARSADKRAGFLDGAAELQAEIDRRSAARG